MFRRLAVRSFFTFVAVAATVALAQDQGGAPSAGGGGAAGGGAGGVGGNAPGGPNPGGNTRGNVPTTPMPGQDPRQQMPEMPRPIFISGKVMLEDGTAPPESVTIERVCNGVARPEGYTDSKGRFSFEVGRNQGMFSDASYGGGGNDPFSNIGAPGAGQRGNAGLLGGMGGRQQMEQELMGCDITARLAGYRAQSISLAGRRSLDRPDIGTIIMRRIANVEGLATSMTTMTAPKDARKSYEKGKDQMKKNKLADAEKELTKAVDLHPNFAAAWYELGRIHLNNQKPNEAKSAFGKAIESDPKFINPYLPMSQMALTEQSWEEAATFSGKLIRLNPVDFPHAFLINGIANFNLKNYDEAEKSAREAVKLDTQNRSPKAHHLLGALLAEKGELAPAAVELKDYLKFAPNAGDADGVRKLIGEIESRLGGGAAQAQPQPAQP